MNQTLLRGRILTYVREPVGPEDTDAFIHIEDGALVAEGGRIAAVGAFTHIAPAWPKAKTIDHRPHLLMPGFIDTHLHMPQTQVIASWGKDLLYWLNTYTFPEEARFADHAHAADIAGRLLDTLLRHGTTTAVAYCSGHRTSAEALFAAAAARNQFIVAGKVMMNRNAPSTVLDTAQSGYDESEALIAKWHGRGRAQYAITPRFAITSTPAQLEAAGALARNHSDCYVQTHLSENADEIALTAELYPKARDYFDVYQHYGLAGPKSLFGHCLHMSGRERAAMGETGSVAVFCPTSNLFLGSGLFDAGAFSADGVRQAIATDIGGGTSYSMQRTHDEGFEVLQLHGQQMHLLRAFCWIRRGNAEALSASDRSGALDPGNDTDTIVLNARATPEMALRMARVDALADELFVLQTLGDERAIAQTYVAGRPMLPVHN